MPDWTVAARRAWLEEARARDQQCKADLVTFLDTFFSASSAAPEYHHVGHESHHYNVDASEDIDFSLSTQSMAALRPLRD